ncbi:uncharacterized protein LOC142553917 [Primulina tabacum]|uniref:uncharacterized protein LOC142553917 n=1 Tax=Primulina tabacum TaxID=48773 RepID=UPI003F5A5889
MAGAYTLNAYQVNFASVLNIKDENLVKMFQDIEKSGLRKFLEAPAVIYKNALLDFYAKATVHEGKIVHSQGDASISIDAALLGATFLLPLSGTSELSDISKIDRSVALSSFSASGEEVSPSCHKKLLKMEYQILADIVAKAILIKAGTFDKLTKEKVQVMIAITKGIKVDWSHFLFRIMKDMVVRKSSGFAVQISAMLKDAGFASTSDQDATSVTMIDAANVLALRPKPTVAEFVALKKEIGETASEVQKPQRKISKKRVIISTDSDKTASEESAADVQPPIPTPAKKKPRTILKIKKTTALSEIEKVPIRQIFPEVVPSVRSITSATAQATASILAPPTAFVFKPSSGIVIRESTSGSSAFRPIVPISSSDKCKGKMVEEPPIFGHKTTVTTGVDLHLAEIETSANDDMNFFDEWHSVRLFHSFAYFKTKGNYAKMMNAEKRIFQLAKMENIIEALRRRSFILDQLKCQKLESVLKVLESNFDPSVPTAV